MFEFEFETLFRTGHGGRRRTVYHTTHKPTAENGTGSLDVVGVLGWLASWVAPSRRQVQYHVWFSELVGMTNSVAKGLQCHQKLEQASRYVVYARVLLLQVECTIGVCVCYPTRTRSR